MPIASKYAGVTSVIAADGSWSRRAGLGLPSAAKTEFQDEPSIGREDVTAALVTPGSARVRATRSSTNAARRGWVQRSPGIDSCRVSR